MPYCEITSAPFAARIGYRVEADVEKNQSVVHITGVELRALSGGVYGPCWVTGSITVDGQTGAELILNNTQFCGLSLSQTFSGGDETVWSGFRSLDVTVPHLSDGTAKVDIRAALTIRLTTGTVLEPGVQGIGVVSLPRIPRASDAAAKPVELGQEMIIRLLRAVGSFRDTVTWHCGALSGVIAERTQQTELRWTPPLELAAQAPDRTAVPVEIRIGSFDSSAEVGSRSIHVSCAIPAWVVPSAAIAAEDSTGIAEQYGRWLRSRSRAKITVEAAGTYGSTIAEIVVNCGGLLGTGAETVFELPNSGNISVSVTVTDSRGRKASASLTIPVEPYEKPRAVIREVYRCDAAGNSQPDGVYAAVLFDAAVTPVPGGRAAYQLVRSVHGGAALPTVELAEYENQFTVSGGRVILPAGADSAYDVRLRAADSFGAEESLTALIPTAFVMLDFSRDSRAVGIGMRARREGKLCIGLDADLEEHRLGNLASPAAGSDAATKAYVDGLVQRLAELAGISLTI